MLLFDTFLYFNMKFIIRFFQAIFHSCYNSYISFNLFKTEAVIIQKPLCKLLCKSMDWFLYDNGLRLERVKGYLVTKIINTFFRNLNIKQKFETGTWIFLFWNQNSLTIITFFFMETQNSRIHSFDKSNCSRFQVRYSSNSHIRPFL